MGLKGVLVLFKVWRGGEEGGMSYLGHKLDFCEACFIHILQCRKRMNRFPANLSEPKMAANFAKRKDLDSNLSVTRIPMGDHLLRLRV